MRTVAIGDVHGCDRQLAALLDAVGPAGDDQVVFLGDLVDRGPDSRGVIDRVLRLSRACRVTVVQGNHEQMMLDARKSHAALTDWLSNGGDATLRSYAGVRGTLQDVPAEHWRLIEHDAVAYLETATHLFVHANAYPDLPMAEQPDYMLRWERCDQIAPHESGKVIVYGHTPQRSGEPMNRDFAICLDTDASRGGPLTALDVVSGRVWQATANGQVTRSHLSDYEA